MRRELVVERCASIVGVLLVAAACSGQCGRAAPSPVVKTTPAAAAPSPSPTAFLPLAASGPVFHGGEVGVAYSPMSVTAEGGKPPYSWSVVSGALPGGLTLGSDGSVSGTPTAAGNFVFGVQVTDALTHTSPFTGQIVIAPALTAGLVPSCARYCNVELGCVGVCGAFGLQSGGVGPYTYTLTQGPLPAGTSLNGLSLNGTFKGSSGWLQFTVQVGDALGATALLSPRFWMYDHVSLPGDGTTCFYIWTDCTLHLPIGGGVPGGSPSVALVAEAPQPGNQAGQGCWNQQSPTPLPAGYTLTVANGAVNLYIPRSQNTNGYGGAWTLVVTDHTFCSGGTNCTSQPAVVRIGINCT